MNCQSNHCNSMPPNILKNISVNKLRILHFKFELIGNSSFNNHVVKLVILSKRVTIFVITYIEIFKRKQINISFAFKYLCLLDFALLKEKKNALYLANSLKKCCLTHNLKF